MLGQEFKCYNDHLEEWLKNQYEKIVLIKGNDVIGFYNTVEGAISEGARRFGMSSFLARPILPEQEAIGIPALTMGILNADSTRTIRR